MKTVTTLNSVETKNGASHRGPWVLSIFKAADGKDYSTLDGGLASLASSMIGKTAEVQYEERTNDRGYTNFSLTGIELAAAGEVAVVVQPQDQGLTYKSNNDQFRTKEQIMRTDALTAALTAFGIAGLDVLSAPDEFEGWFQTFYDVIEAGIFATPDVRVEA